METKDFKTLLDSIPNYSKQSYCLVFNRIVWENTAKFGYDFSKEELDIAEKQENGFIGNRMGVDCYLVKKII